MVTNCGKFKLILLVYACILKYFNAESDEMMPSKVVNSTSRGSKCEFNSESKVDTLGKILDWSMM